MKERPEHEPPHPSPPQTRLRHRFLPHRPDPAFPLIGLIALAIKLDDGGPVPYVQERVGKDGKIFRCYKFRTPGLSSVEGMIVGAENKGLGLEVAKDDPRITRVGRFLRHWTLDEIPQLFNVLKGDMSIVGPRPTVPSQVARYTPWQRRRLEVKPGMAGWPCGILWNTCSTRLAEAQRNGQVVTRL